MEVIEEYDARVERNRRGKSKGSREDEERGRWRGTGDDGFERDKFHAKVRQFDEKEDEERRPVCAFRVDDVRGDGEERVDRFFFSKRTEIEMREL